MNPEFPISVIVMLVVATALTMVMNKYKTKTMN